MSCFRAVHGYCSHKHRNTQNRISGHINSAGLAPEPPLEWAVLFPKTYLSTSHVPPTLCDTPELQTDRSPVTDG